MNFQIVIDALSNIVRDILNFIPNLINGLIILVIGYLVALLVRWIIKAALRRFKFDPMVERAGLTGALRGLGISTPLSAILAHAVFVLLLLSFLITATRLMGLLPVAQIFERILNFLPTLLAATIVFLIGGIVAQFVGNMVSTVGRGAGLTYAARLGRLIQYLISIFVVILALSVMGMDTALLVTVVTIVIAAFGLALGLALGLGARNVVQHILAGYYMRQRFPVGRAIAVGEVSGEVGGIGGVNTVVRTADGTVVFPNSVLLESTLRSPGAQPE